MLQIKLLGMVGQNRTLTLLTYEPHHENIRFLPMCKHKGADSCAVNALLIAIFVFGTGIVQFLFFLNPKFQAPSHLLLQQRQVCVPFEEGRVVA